MRKLPLNEYPKTRLKLKLSSTMSWWVLSLWFYPTKKNNDLSFQFTNEFSSTWTTGGISDDIKLIKCDILMRVSSACVKTEECQNIKYDKVIII